MNRSAIFRVIRTVLLMLLLAACVADSSMLRGACTAEEAAEPVVSRTSGRMVVLPGVGNTRFHLAPFVRAAEAQLPGFDIDVRRWGVRFMMFLNLRAYERNLETARQIAAELASWRRAHPDELLYVVGYSGGGGMALLMAEALAEDVMIDRLVLVAPAISPGYAVEEILPRVRELVVSYASERDLQVGWGTRTFGTIDRKRTASAGAVGFELTHPKIVEWRWSSEARELGHRGNHLSYLGRRWQVAHLLPALDPRVEAAELRAAWTQTCARLNGSG